MQTLRRIYGASFIFSISLALAAYVNSSFLSEHVGVHLVGIIYAIAALLIIAGLEILPKIIERIGNRSNIFILIIFNMCALAILSSGGSPILTAGAFIVFNTTNSLIWYSLDIFIEHFSANKKVGSIRGAYLSLTNFAWVLSPIIAGTIVTMFGFSSLYTVVLVVIAVLSIILHFSLRTYHDNKYRPLSSIQAFKSLLKRPDLLRITTVNFILQFFYSWMVIYAPLYLHEVHHISFETIGIMFTIMVMPFVLLEYPIGRLSDAIHHERELIQIGILILAGSTFLFGYSLFNGNIIIITAILFATRCGAGIVEVITESYFFKSVTDRDAEIIGLFRTTYPLAYLIAPLCATIILGYTSYNTLFLILGGFVLLAIFPLDRLANLENA